MKSFQIVSKIFSYSAIHDDKAHNNNSEHGQLTPKNDLPVIIIIIIIIYFAQNHRTVKYVQEEKFQNIRIKVTRILTTRSWWQATVYRSLHPVTYTHINVCMHAQMDKLPKNIMPLKHCCNYTHTHPFNGPLSGTTQVSRHQKGKTNLDFTGARDSEWQWHQLGHMQICTLLQTDNHASTSLLSFYRPDALPATQPTASKHWRQMLQLCNGIKTPRKNARNERTGIPERCKPQLWKLLHAWVGHMKTITYTAASLHERCVPWLGQNS